MAARVVSIDNKRYNYRVDQSGRRIWLEDIDSKRQWQWLGTNARPSKPSHTMPESVALATLKSLFAKGGRHHIKLVENSAGGLRLTLRLPRSKKSWSTAGSFELEAIRSMTQTRPQKQRIALADFCELLNAIELEGHEL